MLVSTEKSTDEKSEMITIDASLFTEMVQTIRYYAEKKHITNRVDNPENWEKPEFDSYHEEVLIEDGTRAATLMDRLKSQVRN